MSGVVFPDRRKALSWEEQKQASANTRRVLCDRCAGQGVYKGANG
jgi:hypothetical protein